MTNTYLNLAAYHYRRAVFYAALGDTEKAIAQCQTARKYDEFAQSAAI